MKKIIFSLVIFLFLSCFGYKSTTKKNLADNKYAIISNQEYIHWLFGKAYLIKDLNDIELIRIDSLLQIQIENKSLYLLEVDNLKELKEKYYRQYLCYENEFGHKIAYVNSFCSVPEVFSEGEMKELKWKTEMIDVSDGGNCYWSVKIDLTENRIFDIAVNTKE